MSRAVAPLPRRLGTRFGTLVAAGVLAVTGLAVVSGAEQPADASGALAVSARKATNPVTPGDFTGYGFDQCLAPTQAKMDRWLASSPFLAVGIYISGNSRACRSQPNLTPTWVATQLAKGWRLLPITLGPQSTCVGRFPRYGKKIDPTISNSSTSRYAAARNQGVVEAGRAVSAASALGIVAGSTLWYDIEGWSNAANATCRESALAFVSGWTTRIHQLGYVSGVYSSVGSGLKVIDAARQQGRTDVVLPDAIWMARWDGMANTSTSYIAEDGWRPGRRVKQYQGGHNETWGGVTINIDRNFLDVGRGSVARPETHCGGVRISRPAYPTLHAPDSQVRPAVKTLQCLLREQGRYRGAISGRFTRATLASFNSFLASHGWRPGTAIGRRGWVALLATGPTSIVKYGSVGTAVTRVQRALNAANAGPAAGKLVNTGVFDAATVIALKEWQKKVRVEVSGVASPTTWTKLQAGAY